jgi:acyl-CoA reductase-like NAD-dependent aldehyde dehydrogenase
MNELEVTSPYDERRLDTLPVQTESECMGLLEQAHAAFEDRSGWLPAHVRLQILERAAALIEDRVESLARRAAEEGGKPIADSRIEVRRAVEGVKTAIAEMRGWSGREIPMDLSAATAGRLAWTRREPCGVVFAVSAFNHPFNLIVHQVVPAIAVGAPVLVKPAAATPLSCRNLVEILYEAGLPEKWCRMIVCSNDVTTKIVGDRRTAFLTFIGSGRVGWMLRSKLAEGAHCALEHGGLAPVIVDATADLDDAVPLLAKGGFYHAGQVCVSVQRIFVHESRADDLLEKLTAAAKAMKVGDPLSDDTEVGPLIRRAEVTRVHDWVEKAVAGGAQLLTGGKLVGDTCYEPTVLVNPAPDAEISTKEVFGPVVAVYRYADLDDAIARANSADAYFQAAVFTRDLETALHCSQRLNAMAVMVNDHSAFRADWMPFGGHEASGLGAGGIGYSMRDMSIERMIVLRNARA